MIFHLFTNILSLFLIFTDKTLYLVNFYTNTSIIKSLYMIGLKIDYVWLCIRSIM